MAGGEVGAFGALLRGYRRAAALSQEALAERAGISAVAISALERGARRAPYLGTVELLADALGLAAPDRAALLSAARPRATDRGGEAAGDGLVPLAGRARELALLDAFLAGEGGPPGPARVLLLAGEPGVGKTRLLQAAAQRAVARGWAVLAGGCQRRGGQEPYAPLLEALALHLQPLGLEQRRVALVGCAWLARLLPELADDLEPLPGGTLPPAQELRLIHAAVARLLANIAGPAGTLLVLDDLQWSGPDALDLMRTLVRGVRVRVVGAYRDTEVGPADPLGMLLADLAQARLARQHSLGPLAADEAAALLDDLLVDVEPWDRGAVDAVLRRAGGTPFFLVSYAQALRQGGAAGVPWDVAQGLRQRLALLPAAGRQVAGIAAVIGRRAPRAVLLAAAGQPEEEALSGLEAACRARLLLEEGDDAYVFAHDLIREVVEAEVGTARRAALHRRVAEILERDPAGSAPEALAYHYGHAGMPDKAAVHLERAGDHAWATRAHGAAGGHYREALDRLEALGRAQDALRVREKLAEVHKRTGFYAAALELLEPIAARYRAAGDLEGLVRVTASMGETHVLRGAVEEGIACLRALLDQLGGAAASVSLAAPYLWLGVLLLMSGRYQEALGIAERAVALAGATGDERTLVRARWNHANVLQLLGRLEVARPAYDAVLALAEAQGDLEALVSVSRDLAHIHTLQGAFAAGGRHFARSLAAAEQMESPAELYLTLAMRGDLVILAGEWRQARADLDRAQSVRRQTDRSWQALYLPIFAAHLPAVEGDWGAAAASLQEAIALAGSAGDPQALRWASRAMAELEILEGRPQAARERLLPLLDRHGIEECDVTALLPVLAWARLELGEEAQAERALAEAIRRARSEQLRLVLVDALRVQAMLAVRQGRWGDAERSLEEGLGLARAMPYPYAEGRLLRVYGSLHTGRGEPEPARERLAAALAIFRRLGARKDAERTDELLTTLG